MSKRNLLSLATVILSLLTAGGALAEDSVLVVRVTYLDKKPLARIRIGTSGDGSIETTDVGGRARIHLAPGVKVGQEIALQVLPSGHPEESWVFISPWDRRVSVPPFDNDRVVEVVLAKRADRDALLSNSDGRKAIEQSILTKLSELQQARSEVTAGQRKTVLEAQAAEYGLKPDEVDAAIRVAAQKAAMEPFERGLAALYEKNYPLASQNLAQARASTEEELMQTQQKLTQLQKRLAEQAFFLGQSLSRARALSRFRGGLEASQRVTPLERDYFEFARYLSAR